MVGSASRVPPDLPTRGGRRGEHVRRRSSNVSSSVVIPPEVVDFAGPEMTTRVVRTGSPRRRPSSSVVTPADLHQPPPAPAPRTPSPGRGQDADPTPRRHPARVEGCAALAGNDGFGRPWADAGDDDRRAIQSVGGRIRAPPVIRRVCSMQHHRIRRPRHSARHTRRSGTVALVACARKLLVFANTVVARGTPWIERPDAA